MQPNNETNLKAYAQWVNFSLQPKNFDLSIQNSSLSWGKFYNPISNKDSEVSTGTVNTYVAKAKTTLTFGSCGRSDASAGTEGSFDLYDGKTKIGTLSWDCPWGSKTNSYSWAPVDPDSDYIVQVTGGNLDSGALGTLTIIAGKTA